jgi:hypothetical protein
MKQYDYNILFEKFTNFVLYILSDNIYLLTYLRCRFATECLAFIAPAFFHLNQAVLKRLTVTVRSLGKCVNEEVRTVSRRLN